MLHCVKPSVCALLFDSCDCAYAICYICLKFAVFWLGALYCHHSLLLPLLPVLPLFALGLEVPLGMASPPRDYFWRTTLT